MVSATRVHAHPSEAHAGFIQPHKHVLKQLLCYKCVYVAVLHTHLCFTCAIHTCCSSMHSVELHNTQHGAAHDALPLHVLAQPHMHIYSLYIRNM